MQRILGIFCALLLTVQAFSQVTDSVLTVRANVIRNEPTPGGNTKVRVANMFQDLTNSKVSLLSTYTNPTWLTSLPWSKITSTPTTLSTYGITDAVPTSRTLTINGTTYDLSANRSWTITAGVWGQISGTLSDQTDLGTALGLKVPTSRSLTINGTAYDLSADRSWTISAGVWGSITGTLSSQTDLNTALSGKVATTTTVNGSPLSSNVTITNITGNAGTVTTNANLTGDVTSTGNATTIATVNSNVGTFGSATQSLTTNVNGKGQITAISAQTITPAVGSITGLGTSVASFLASPTSANLANAVTNETGTASLVFSDSPALTGIPTAPTASTGTNTTQVATTAFVFQEKGLQLSNTQTGDYTLVLADKGYRVEMNKATALTLTVPPNSSVAYPTGTVIYPIRTGAGTLTIAQGAGVTITGSSGALTDPGQNVEMKLVKTGTDTWLLQNGNPGVWLDWTTTFVGFSVNPTPYYFRYTVIGKTCFYWFTMGTDGTSNSTSFTMTFPFAAKSGVQNQFHSLPFVVNNSAAGASPGRLTITTGSNVMSLGRDATGAVWTASGGKRASGSGSYEIDFVLFLLVNPALFRRKKKIDFTANRKRKLLSRAV
jgi:hypothetical protein